MLFWPFWEKLWLNIQFLSDSKRISAAAPPLRLQYFVWQKSKGNIWLQQFFKAVSQARIGIAEAVVVSGGWEVKWCCTILYRDFEATGGQIVQQAEVEVQQVQQVGRWFNKQRALWLLWTDPVSCSVWSYSHFCFKTAKLGHNWASVVLDYWTVWSCSSPSWLLQQFQSPGGEESNTQHLWPFLKLWFWYMWFKFKQSVPYV